LSTDVSEVRAASIIIPEDNSELHTRRRENFKSHTIRFFLYRPLATTVITVNLLTNEKFGI
jgi:hypothetical protein